MLELARTSLLPHQFDSPVEPHLSTVSFVAFGQLKSNTVVRLPDSNRIEGSVLMSTLVTNSISQAAWHAVASSQNISNIRPANCSNQW